MLLPSGTRLGAYEIIAPIGSGGMGDVYRAHDSRLGRDVAIKVSAEQFSERFEREARAIAALNHTNICHLYDVGPIYLVMEIVEGQTLAGPLPLNEALPLIRQLIDGIEAAHDKAIVHRDLKPANIKVTPDGVVKILDFGLAKAADPDVPVDTANSPTMTFNGTKAGVILGTAAYMSPEQARGKPADRRSDIFSFGAVVYELLTGGPAFTGESVADLLSAVLNKEPDWSKVPASIRGLLQWCMEKDRRQRLQAIGDARRWLDAGSAAAPAETRSSTRQMWLNRGVAAVLGVALVAAVVILSPAYFTNEPAAGPAYTASIIPPVDLTVTPPGRFALSTDGRRLAFVAPDAEGRNVLWIRALSGLSSQPLAGTEGATSPFWSPDSRYVAFVAGGRLRKIDAAGGQATTIVDGVGGSTGAWTQGDVIVVSVSVGDHNVLPRVSAGGGATTPVAPADTASYFPSFLPDGRHFVYLGLRNVYVRSIDGKDRTLLLEGAGSAIYAQGYLVFLRGTTLYAQRFDVEHFVVKGEPVRLAERIQISTGSGAGAFSVSEAGTLVYQSAAAAPSQLTWFDAVGNAVGTVGTPGEYGDLQLSRDCTRVAASPTAESSFSPTLWTLDVARGSRSRLTQEGSEDGAPVWSPDGRQIAYVSRRGSTKTIYMKDVGGSGSPERLTEDSLNKQASSWSPDGRFLLYSRVVSNKGVSLWTVEASGDHKLAPVVDTPAREGNGQFSPDGRWVAYQSNESGRDEVYVTEFPTGGQRFPISSAGGIVPRWSRDGREIFFVSGNVLMGASVTTDTARVNVGRIRQLFEVQRPAGFETYGFLNAFYDVAPDGRFLANTAIAQTTVTPITLLVNWTAMVRQ